MSRNQTSTTTNGSSSSDSPRSQRDARSRRGGRRPMSVAVSVRQQTPEEEGRFHAALHLFLSEIVRQQLVRDGGDHE